MPESLPAFYETGVWLTEVPGTPDDHLRYPQLPEFLEIPDKGSGMISLKRQCLEVIVAAKDRMVRLGEWKLSYQPLTQGAIYRLFNVAADPGCQVDVMSSHPEIGERLKAILLEWIGADASVVSATETGISQRVVGNGARVL